METKNWKWFRYDEIFDIKKGKRLTKANMVNGDIPYIGATDSNNGITARISNNEHLHSANTITVSYNGSIAEAYYQTKMFWATDDVNVLYPKFAMNVYSAMFFTTIINKEKYRFNYGRKWDKDLMEVSTIKLPIDKNNNPDWQWIENYVKEILVSKLSPKVKQVWKKNFDKTPLSSNNLQLNTKEWKWFKIGDLFNVELTKGDIKADRIDYGPIPLISSGESNNGIVKYILEEGDGKAEKFSANNITLDMFCHAYYHPYEFYAVGHGRVNILKPKFKLNKYLAVFICSLIDKELYRFSYGRAIYSNVAKNIKLKLPAIQIANGEYEPDWQWMEDYIKGLPYSRNI